jgi:hypothetical protein
MYNVHQTRNPWHSGDPSIARIPGTSDEISPMEVGGIESQKTPSLSVSRSTTEGPQNSANADHSTSSAPSDKPTSKCNEADVEHKYDESKQQKYVICVTAISTSVARLEGNDGSLG